MANAFTIWATLNMDTSEFESKLGRVRASLPKQGGAMMNKLNAQAVAAGNLLSSYAQKALSVVVDIGKQALGVTGELEQNMGGSEAVWGEWADNIQRIGATAFKTMGMSQSGYLAEANKMGSLLKGSGFTTAEAFELSTQVMQRAADVASIMGIDVKTAMQAVEGAAKGNFTMMDNLGVAINETALSNYVLEKGIAKSTKGMSGQQKTALALQMFLEKTADYTGNYAKENDTLAGSLATVSAAWENFLSGAGEDPAGDLADSVARAAKVLMKNVREMVPRLATGAVRVLQKLGPMIKDWLATVDFKDLGAKVGAGLKSFMENLPELLANIRDALANGWAEIVWPALQGYFSAAFGVELPDWNTLVEDISTGWNETVWPAIQGFFKETFGLDLPSWEATVKGITEWWDNVKKAYGNVFSAVFSIFTEDEDGLTVAERLKKWWDKVSEAVGDYYRALFGLDFPAVDNMVQEIQAWWDGIKKKVVLGLGIKLTTPKTPAKIPSVNESTFDDGFPTMTPATTQEEVDSTEVGTWPLLFRTPGSNAKGLDYVPYNDYLTYLHKGEAVLTAQDATAWRAGAAGIDYGTLADVLTSRLAYALDGALVEMDSREVGRLVLPTVSREMGWEIRRRS